LETVLVAVVSIAVGVAVAAFGARLFFVLLPVWGFLTGFVLGADLLAALAGEGILATAAGWAVGGALGLALALVARLWFYGAVLILGVGLGAAVVSGFLASIGITGELLTLVIGIAVGIAVGVAIILTGAPPLVVAAITGYAGAVWLTAGVMLLLGRVHLADLHGVGAAGALRGDVLAVVMAFGVGTVAFGFQALDLRARGIDAMGRERYRFGRGMPGAAEPPM
jgi:hypothetical protein